MPASYDLQLDQGAIDELCRGDEVTDMLDNEVGPQVVELAQGFAPKASGRGAENIDHEVGEDADGVYVDIGYQPAGFYMAFLELGTEEFPAEPHLRPAIGEDLDL